MQFLQDLNPAQRQAVTTTEGPVLVLAGACSGKTRVITYRIVYLVKKLGIAPQKILAVTFTNKAANEMKERVSAFTGNLKGLNLSTLHSFGVKFLKEEIDRLGYMDRFSIYSESDTQALLKNIELELNLDEENTPKTPGFLDQPS